MQLRCKFQFCRHITRFELEQLSQTVYKIQMLEMQVDSRFSAVRHEKFLYIQHLVSRMLREKPATFRTESPLIDKSGLTSPITGDCIIKRFFYPEDKLR